MVDRNKQNIAQDIGQIIVVSRFTCAPLIHLLPALIVPHQGRSHETSFEFCMCIYSYTPDLER